jgi:hypothetical protein
LHLGSCGGAIPVDLHFWALAVAELNVWIQIEENGAAYQCRIGREATVFSASGSFISLNSIEWKNI